MIVLLIVALSATGCGLIVHGTRQTVRVDSTPSRALAVLAGQAVSTPAEVTVSRRPSTLVLRGSKPGYQPNCEIIDAAIGTPLITTLDSIPAAIPLLLDFIAGSLHNYPSSAHVTLRPLMRFEATKTLPSDEEILGAWHQEPPQKQNLCLLRTAYQPCIEGPTILKNIDQASRKGSEPDIKMADPLSVLASHPNSPEELAEVYIADCSEHLVGLSAASGLAAYSPEWQVLDMSLRAQQSGLDFMKWWLQRRQERTP